MKLPQLCQTQHSDLRPENAQPASSHQGPSPLLRPDYFITVCLQAEIALLKPQIIIITIIRNSCGGGIGTLRENICVPTVPRITPVELRGPQGMRALPKPVNATPVRFTHPTCQDGDAVGLIFLIDTFPSPSTLSHLTLILPFVFLFFSQEKKNSSPLLPEYSKGKKPTRGTMTYTLSSRKYRDLNKVTHQEMHQKSEK